MNTSTITQQECGTYALFMACNQHGQRHGKGVRGMHRNLYDQTNQYAENAGVRNLKERMAWDETMKTAVSRHFDENSLVWDEYVAAVSAVYKTRAIEDVQKRFGFT